VEVTNNFKGLDLIDKVLEAHDIVQEAVIKTIPKKKKCKKAKRLSEEALQIAVKRREVAVSTFIRTSLHRKTHVMAQYTGSQKHTHLPE